MLRISKFSFMDGYRLILDFSDGVSGIADISNLVGKGVFAAWRNINAFQQVRIGSAGELVWENGIDLYPDSLYLKITGKKPEDLFPALRCEHTHA